MYYKRQWNSYFANRMQVSYLKVSGTDKGDPVYNTRNLSFQTPIYEFFDAIEFNFQKFGMNHNDNLFTPYCYTGIAGFLFEPTRLENEDIKLRNLKTEGQHKGYSLFQPSIPIGFGFKTMMSPQKNRGVWVFAIECCWRKTLTDYLDDVSGTYPDYKTMVDRQGQGAAQYSQPQTLNGGAPYASGTMRGDNHLKDWYYTIGITLSYRFPGGACPAM